MICNLILLIIVTRWDMNEESEQVVSLDSPDDAREQLKETTNEKIKGIHFIHFYMKKKKIVLFTVIKKFS